MMDNMNLGFSEMVFLFLLALIIFGPKKLPEIGRQVGKALAEFKRASNEFKAQLDTEMRQIELEETLRKDKEREAESPSILPTVAGVAENSVDALGVTSVDPLSHPYAADTSATDTIASMGTPQGQTEPEPVVSVPEASAELTSADSHLAALPSPEAPAASETAMQSIPRSVDITPPPEVPAALPAADAPLPTADEVEVPAAEKSPKSDYVMKGPDA